jgi:hypothetical protein
MERGKRAERVGVRPLKICGYWLLAGWLAAAGGA